MSPEKVFATSFKNKTNLKQEFEYSYFDNKNFVLQLFGQGYDNVHIISMEISGNDLIVNYVLFNNFSFACLSLPRSRTA